MSNILTTRSGPPSAVSRTSGVTVIAQDAGLYGLDRPGTAWDWMRQSGQPPTGADWVRPKVADAWARCVDEHHLPTGVDFAPRLDPVLTCPEDFELWRREWSSAFTASLSAMAYDFRSYLDESSVTLVLCDPLGKVFYVLDAGLNIRPGGVAMARIGADWRECNIGNTGIGTACLLRVPAAFNGREHFSPAFHPYATAGCPIASPDGGIVAFVGLITDRRDAASLMLGFLKLACRLLEANLFDSFFSTGRLLRLRDGDVTASSSGPESLVEGLVAVKEEGRISGVNQSALHLLGASTHIDVIGKELSSFLRVDLAACEGFDSVVLAHSNSGRPLRVERRLFGPLTNVPRARTERKSREEPSDTAPVAPFSALNAEWRDLILDAALQKAANLQAQNIPLLITGESGVGKDYLVRRLHGCGSRKDRMLVAINCAAIPRELIESELFGYEGGSFTGARSKGKRGKFLEADKGMLFLDEIGDMALDLQATLLRVLESSEITPIGGTRSIPIDVRVVAATNCSLPDMVQKGAFRRDLYYRLNGVQLWLPPLRERPDRLQLIAHLLRQEWQSLGLEEEKEPSDDVWRVFFKHPWPGNIREARNVVRAVLAVTRGRRINIDDLPRDFLQEMNVRPNPAPASLDEAPAFADERASVGRPVDAPGELADWEARAVHSALASSGGNVAKAARSLGITRATLYHKMARYGLRSDRRIVSRN
ncbi:sigma-54-dependent Fis family transcriptional regulator [Methylocystis bryophila]|uniref:Fis family transcriptional regulator n=1 Tax=Methylocystis bryophila TaxID=655015 RepID=A0A1W6MWP2_9HYPH|nr:sigma 54-interacting transcriptional regulator [Methylocystis bryophila]ARN82022.1 Fis family transcriptional regulator [Methylocystis bryophila]BDV38137.1 sigma-54-dependent Fis family transcriptional regulator [Methylocystis bryophila]